jgi:membrane associated rhomboid family serine protease
MIRTIHDLNNNPTPPPPPTTTSNNNVGTNTINTFITTNNNNSNKPDISTWFFSIPWITKLILLSLICIHILTFFFSTISYQFALDPNRVLYQGQVYLLITGSFLHASVGHLTLNSLALASVGSTLEMKLGSPLFLVMVFMLHVLCSTTYVMLSFMIGLLSTTTAVTTTTTNNNNNNNNQLGLVSTVGYSGILFALAVIEVHIIHIVQSSTTDGNNSNPTWFSRTLAGQIYNMPRILRPWAMIIFVQLMFPREASFLGHVGGALTGYVLMQHGDVILPHRDNLIRFDQFILGYGGWLTNNKFSYQTTQAAFTDSTNPFRVRITDSPWTTFISWIRQIISRSTTPALPGNNSSGV